MEAEELKRWLAWRSAEDERLYALYGKPLEAEHTGELVLIGPNGETVLGEDDLTLTELGIERFGSGNFAVRRIGYDYDIRIRGAFK